jgi:hypothetical protein
MDQKDLNKILELHLMWVRGEPEGRRADLSWANLVGSDLFNANLSGADLYEANLRGADLRGADLTDAVLTDADLTDAKLPQGCKYYCDLPKHNIIVIHDVAHIGCHSLTLTDWLERGPDIGRQRGYTEEQIDLYMEILSKEHEIR